MQVRTVVALGRYAHRSGLARSTNADDAAIDEALQETDSLQLAERSFTELSFGEQKRVMIARALATGARTLLLDEPTASLDVEHSLRLFVLLRALATQGRCIVVVLHHLDEALQVLRPSGADQGRRASGARPCPGDHHSGARARALWRGNGVRRWARLSPARVQLMKRRIDLLNAGGFLAAMLLAIYGGSLSSGRGMPDVQLSPELTLSMKPEKLADGTTVLRDANGVAVPLKHYERIASQTLIADRVLSDLCEPTRVVAFTSHGAKESFIAHRLAGKAQLPSRAPVEKILELKPDLLIVNNLVDPGYVGLPARARRPRVRPGPHAWARYPAPEHPRHRLPDRSARASNT